MNRLVYLNGEILEFGNARISPEDRGFLFADGVYEVIRCYHGKLFFYTDHLNRLKYSLDQLRINNVSIDSFEEIILKLIEINGFQNEDATVYIQVTRGAYKRGLAFPPSDVLPTVYMSVSKVEPDEIAAKEGIKAVTVDDNRWARNDIKSIARLSNVLAHQEAIEKGAKVGIYLKNGYLTEGTHTGLFAVKKNIVITHPETNEILKSITRNIVTMLCSKLAIEIIEMPLKLSGVKDMDELFIVGTTPEITAVTQLDALVIGTGKPGQVTKKLQNEFSLLVNSL